MPSLTNVACPPFPCRDKNRWAPCVVCAYNGRRAGESSRCEDPAPTVGIGGDSVAMRRHRPSFAPTWASTGRANGRITTRRAASLRPPRIGRIGFKPPHSKRETAAKGRRGQSFIGGIFLRVEGLITQFNLTKTVAMRRFCEVAAGNHISINFRDWPLRSW